jgi:hypothetical protein
MPYAISNELSIDIGHALRDWSFEEYMDRLEGYGTHKTLFLVLARLLKRWNERISVADRKYAFCLMSRNRRGARGDASELLRKTKLLFGERECCFGKREQLSSIMWVEGM